MFYSTVFVNENQTNVIFEKTKKEQLDAQVPLQCKQKTTCHGFPNSSNASPRAVSAFSHVAKSPKYFSGLYRIDTNRDIVNHSINKVISTIHIYTHTKRKSVSKEKSTCNKINCHHILHPTDKTLNSHISTPDELCISKPLG